MSGYQVSDLHERLSTKGDVLMTISFNTLPCTHFRFEKRWLFLRIHPNQHRQWKLVLWKLHAFCCHLNCFTATSDAQHEHLRWKNAWTAAGQSRLASYYCKEFIASQICIANGRMSKIPICVFFPSIRKHFLRSSQRKQSRKKMNRRWSKAFSGSLKALFDFEVSFTSSICSETSAGRGKESVSFGCNYDAQLSCVVSLCQSRHLLRYSHIICRPIFCFFITCGRSKSQYLARTAD